MGAFPSFEPELDPDPDPVQRLPAPAADDPSVPPLPLGACIVALVDATPAAANAAWRAALVARANGVLLHLLHLHAKGEDPKPLQSQAQDLARRLNARLGVEVSFSVRMGGRPELAGHLPEHAGLVVVAHQRRHPLVESMLGTEAEWIFRCVSLPVLVVRRAAVANYRRVLVPVKLDPEAALMIRSARSLSRDPRPRVLHVLDTSAEQALRIADAPERSVRLQRQRRCRQAYAALNELIASASREQDEAAAALISFGHAPTRVLEIARARHAQLVVVGKRRRSMFAELFDESVPRRLIAAGGTDVLLYPLQGRPAHAGDPLAGLVPIA